jgi:hypothetical protein
MSAPTFEPLGVLARAQDSFGVSPNAPANEWPFNLLSQKAVRFAGGRIGRAGDVVPAAAPAEQKRCDAISAEAAAMGMKLPGRPKAALFDAFRLPALPGEPATEITPELIRERFGGTLHPWATIEVTPLAEYDAYDLSVALFDDYPADRTGKSAGAQVRKWFKAHKDLTGAGWLVEVSGRGANGSQAVRLTVGLTKAGSVVGVAAVGLVSGLTRTMPPAQLYPELIEFELDDFKQWLDGGSGRAVSRVILRAFPPAMMEAWDEGTWAGGVRKAAEKLREKLRPAYWRGEFHKLAAERTLELPPQWEGVQRCVTGGRWDSHWQGEPRPYYDGWAAFGEVERGGDGFYLFSAERVKATAEWFAAHGEAWLKAKYADLRATDYAPFMSEADRKATAAVYARTAKFYADAAADGLCVVSEITARTEAEVAAETAPAKKPKAKGKKGGCEPDDTLLAPLLPCMENPPYCDISPKLVRYSCGRIGRPGKKVEHNHPKGEVDRCRELAAEAERLLAAHEPDHDQGGPYLGFYTAANTGDEVPAAFTPEFVRKSLFNGTINREVQIEVAPLSAGVGDQAEFVNWFTAAPGLHGHAFVSIGVDEDNGGTCHPRLAVAFTEAGSVVGVCGYVVWA